MAVEGLHAWAYCRRLFYFQHVERIENPDERVHAGRELHASIAAEEEGEFTSLELASERLGLAGKVDAVKRRDGVWTPYEHKRGRAARSAEGAAEAWPSDRLQVAAYAALLEDAFGRPVPEGRVRYHADGVTVRVPLDAAARADLDAALADARRLRASLERPPVADNERLCVKCSLAPVCLPEEGRALREPSREPVRLFPPDRDGATLHVLSPGASVGRSGDSLVVRPREGPATKHPVHGVESVLLHGFAQITAQAVGLCVEHGVGVHWMTAAGRQVAALTADVGRVQRRIRQYRALSDESVCLRLARALVVNRLSGQLAYLMRATRGDGDARSAAAGDIAGLRDALAAAGSEAAAPDRDSLRGHEGAGAVRYHAGLRSLLGPQVPGELRAASRNRRPPTDRFNALLSYGYGLLHAAVMRAVLAAGLEPALGFYHTPRSAAHPLVLDLMEPFRVPLWDMVLVGSLNRGQWDPSADFAVTRAKVWLSESGRRKAIGLFEDRLTETWRHPVLGYSLSYARTVELEARLLEKEWTGEPGLFARSRLR
jgi:CRISPR-associated protein Cas1